MVINLMVYLPLHTIMCIQSVQTWKQMGNTTDFAVLVTMQYVLHLTMIFVATYLKMYLVLLSTNYMHYSTDYTR